MRKLLLILALLAHIAPTWSRGTDKDKEKEPAKGQPNTVEIAEGKVSAPNNMVLSKSMQLQLNKSIAALEKQLNAAEANMAKYDDMADVKVNLTENMAQFKAKGEKLLNFLESNPDKLRDISNFTFDSFISLPVGFTVGNENNKITLGILDATIYPGHVTATLFIKADVNSFGRKQSLFFGVEGMSFTQQGFLGTNNFTIKLLGDHILTRPDAKYTLILKGAGDFLVVPPATNPSDTQTWITFGCNGNTNKTEFKALNIKAEAIFPRSTLKPYNINTGNEKDGTDRVKFDLKKFNITQVNKVSNWILQLSVGGAIPFCIPGFEKYGFQVNNLSYDHSDIENPDPIIFPTNYVGEMGPLWRGFYLDNMIMYLPKAFRKRSEEDTPKENVRNFIQADNILIDNTGFTGKISYQSSTDSYSAKKWNYKLAYLEASFLQNKFVSGGFGGTISTPITDENDEVAGSLGYKAIIIGNTNINFTINVDNTVQFPVRALRSKAKFYTGSWVKLVYENDNFYPSCDLSGELEMAVKVKEPLPNDGQPIPPTNGQVGINSTTNPPLESDESASAKFTGLKFRNLRIDPRASKVFSIGDFEYTDNDGSVMAKFPVAITHAYKRTAPLPNNTPSTPTDNDLWIDLGMNISLAKDKIYGETDLVLKTQYNVTTAKMEYKGVSLRDISIAASTSAIDLFGFVNFYDCTEAKGFVGKLVAKLKKPSEMTFCASANFGYNRTENYRYGYVDGFLQSMPGAGFPTGLGDLLINGGGLGLYFNMKPTPIGSPLTTCNVVSASCDQNRLFTYQPNNSILFGFKVMVGLTNSTGSFQGMGSLDFALNRNYGINHIAAMGRGAFGQDKVDADALNTKAKLQDEGKVSIDGNSNEALANQSEGTSNARTLLANAKQKNVKQSNTTASLSTFAFDFGAYLDVPAKTFHAECEFWVNKDKFRGINQGGSVGLTVLHIEQNNFYLHVGKSLPKNQRIGIKYDNKFNLTAYLMVGKGIPTAFPPPSNRVLNYLGQNTLPKNRTTAQLADLATGSGIAFGAAIETSINERINKKWHATAALDAGFDVMVLNNGGRCNPNGRFFNGQLYGYADVSIFKNNKKKGGTSLGFLFNASGFKPKTGFAGTIKLRPPIIGFLTGDVKIGVTIGDPCLL